MGATTLPDSVPKFSSFSSYLGTFFSSVMNLFPRVKQKHNFTNSTSTEYDITSFTDVAVEFLIHNDAGSGPVLEGIGKYAITIIPPLIITSLFFLWDFFMSIWWCVRQCASADNEAPEHCLPCRDPNRACARKGCRVCYLIFHVVAIFGLALIMVSSLNLNKNIKEVFDQVNTVVSYFFDAIDDFGDLLDVGSDILAVTAGIGDVIQDEGKLEKLQSDLAQLHTLARKAQNYDRNQQRNPDYGLTAPNQTAMENSIKSFYDDADEKFSTLSGVCNTSRELVGRLSSNMTQLKSSLWGFKDQLTDADLTTFKASVPASINAVYSVVYNKTRTATTTIDDIVDDLVNIRDNLPDPTTITATLNDVVAEVNAYMDEIIKFEDMLNKVTAYDGSNCDILNRRAWMEDPLDNPSSLLRNAGRSFRSRNAQTVTQNDLKDQLTVIKDWWTTAAKWSNMDSLANLAEAVDASTDNTAAILNEFHDLMDGTEKLDQATMDTDDLFHTTGHTLARASRYMNGLDEFISDFKSLYEVAGNVAWNILVAVAAVFAVVIVLSLFCCMPCCAKDGTICCMLCIQNVFSIVFGILTLVLMLLSLILMDVHKDIYKAEDLKKIEPVLDYVVRIPLAVDIDDTMYEHLRQTVCGYTAASHSNGKASKGKYRYTTANSVFRSLPESPRQVTYSHPYLSSPNVITPPSEHEFLPFVCLNGGELGDYYLRRNSTADPNPVYTTFFDKMEAGFQGLLESSIDPSNYLATGTFGSTILDSINTNAQTANDSFTTFRSTTLEPLLSFDDVSPLLYNFLNVIFGEIAFDASLFWFGGFLVTLTMGFSKPIAMCGRTGWVKKKGKKGGGQRKANKQPTKVKTQPQKKKQAKAKGKAKKRVNPA
ncbi:hypothetical protein BLNAU_18589 [Blattamonas nauphoetae]|uniref:Uncharacterized protein n=1 Tax=Blattamonas nauphoetae TaxID=2049346 RepID=A0ABQ9X3Y8_9EUKA|nr:hypothetical protein BLNAU_18589 [Blattamonas nauphoetae]